MQVAEFEEALSDLVAQYLDGGASTEDVISSLELQIMTVREMSSAAGDESA